MGASARTFRAASAGGRVCAFCISALLSLAPAYGQSGGAYVIKKSTIDSGVGTLTGGGYRLSGTAGQHDAGDPTGGGYVLSGGFWSPAPAVLCADAADCCDLNSNGIRDDNCKWCECLSAPLGTCNQVDIIFADMGGAFGACPPDGFANLFDRNHALTCFGGTNPCNPLNLDAGGPFGACPPDGFCNIFDANHALTSFAGTNPCTCPANPAAEAAPVVAGQTGLSVVADAAVVQPGEKMTVRVFTDAALDNMQGYQLHLSAEGGRRGRLELVDIRVEANPAAAFDAALAGFSAFNIANGQMLNGLEGGGVLVAAKAYLATFTYRVSRDAAGAFVIDVRHNEEGGDQTFLVSDFNRKIEIIAATPVVISVGTERRALP